MQQNEAYSQNKWTAKWQEISNLMLHAQSLTYLLRGKTRILAEPFLSPQHCTGWIGQDEGKRIRWQDTNNAKRLVEVTTQTQFSHTQLWCIFINYLSISKGRAGGEYFETVFLLCKLTE